LVKYPEEKYNNNIITLNNYLTNKVVKQCTIIPFRKLNKALNIKYDILNIKSIKNLKDYGCKILFLDFSTHDYSHNREEIYIEDS